MGVTIRNTGDNFVQAGARAVIDMGRIGKLTKAGRRIYAEGKASGTKSEKMPKHFPDFGARGKNRPRTDSCQLHKGRGR